MVLSKDRFGKCKGVNIMLKLKEKILRREKIIGMHVTLTDITVAKMAGIAGYDFIWVDFEHSYMSYETLLGHIITIQGMGTPVIVRAPQNDLTATKKIMEMGPDGIIFPMIHNAAEADKVMAMTLYPPNGTRGFGPMNAVDYGFADVTHYVQNNHKDMCRFIQIEHREAVEDLDNIMKREYIDGYIFGPMDLSGSINELLNIFGSDTTRLMENAIRRLKDEGKYIGLSTGDISENTLQYWNDMGIDMISAGADYDFLRILMCQNRDMLERIFGNSCRS